MKKLNLMMFALAGCLAITSCSDDDDSNNTVVTPTNQNLTGSYQLTSLNAPNAQDYDNDGDSSTNLIFEGACYNDSWISFHSDGTYDQSYRYTSTGTGGTSLDCSVEVTSGTYDINGNTITTHASGNASLSTTYTYDVVAGTLTGSNNNGAYSAWNATSSLWATLTGTLQFTYTKYTTNDDDNGATADNNGANDDENNSNFWLLGNFSLTSYLVATAQDLDNDGDSSTNLTTESSCYAQSHITFHQDGTYDEETTTNVLAGIGLSLTCNTTTTYGTWTHEGDTVMTHRTSSGSGSVDVTYTLNSATHLLTRNDSNGSYPVFNLGTSLYSMLTGAIAYTYTRSN